MKSLLIGLIALSSMPAFAHLTAAAENLAQLEVVADSEENCIQQRDETIKTLRDGNKIIVNYGACTVFSAGYRTPKFKAIIQVFKY